MGFRSKVARSTLADANESRDWRIYADFAQVLIAIARPLYASDPIGVDRTRVSMLWTRPPSIFASRFSVGQVSPAQSSGEDAHAARASRSVSKTYSRPVNVSFILNGPDKSKHRPGTPLGASTPYPANLFRKWSLATVQPHPRTAVPRRCVAAVLEPTSPVSVNRDLAITSELPTVRELMAISPFHRLSICRCMPELVGV
jgi:hypothetical protein